MPVRPGTRQQRGHKLPFDASDRDGNIALFQVFEVVDYRTRAGPSMSKVAARYQPSLSVRIDLDPESRIGPGKIQLLENIEACGSISAAGLSYKRAWDLVDEINRICGQSAVERQTGGKNGGGAILTPFGTSLVARYRKIERAAAAAVRTELTALRSEIGRSRKTSRSHA
jgi:molybdate transport system regulatory protein